ncbi:MAG: hypothetical protein LQ351_003437 [Letrouitia transgressa]|nr:MAG: hypothetical protein LQ351_003437 [Letrouitia transgressa]
MGLYVLLRKTSIARRYAYFWLEILHGSAFWINADTIQSLEADIRKAVIKMSHLDKVNDSMSAEQVIETFRSWLEQNILWILIFDNADDIQLDFLQYLPSSYTGHVLFTTRDSRLARILPNAYEINVQGLPRDEALDMFGAVTLRRDIEEEIIGKEYVPSLLVRKLEYFPLAIAQAGFFLKVHNTIRGSEYLRYLDDESERLKLLSYATGTENYNRSVATTWEVSLQKLAQDEDTKPAAKLLTFLGFLDPAGVTIDYLQSAFRNQAGKIRSVDGQCFDFLKKGLDFRLSVDILAALSLIQVSPDPYQQEYGTLILHPLAHEWTRVRLNLTPDRRTLRDEMINCNHALALHNFDIREESFGNGWTPQLKHAERKQHCYNTETVILLTRATLYGERSGTEIVDTFMESVSMESIFSSLSRLMDLILDRGTVIGSLGTMFLSLADVADRIHD